MKQLTGLILAFFITINASAAEIKFTDNLTWKQIKEKAAKENKMIFFDAYTAWCAPCKYLEKYVYTNEGVAAYYNQNYISVKFDMEKGEGIELAKEFSIDSYPTLLFFSADGKLVHKYIGATDIAGFIRLGEDAANPNKQYQALKEKAASFTLTDAEFTNWAFQAGKLQDHDKGSIIRNYLAGKKDILANKEIAITALFQASLLTETQMQYLLNSSSRIGELFNIDAEQIGSVLYKRVFNQAMTVYQKSGQNTDSFYLVIKKYMPAKEDYAQKDFLFKEALRSDKNLTRATDLLLQYLDDRKNPVSIEAIAYWIEEFSSVIDKDNSQRLINRLAHFVLQENDNSKKYFLYLAQMSCFNGIGDNASAKEYALKAFHSTELPVEYKEILKETWGFTES